MLATGIYTWTGLNAVSSIANNQPLTNGQCANVQKYYSANPGAILPVDFISQLTYFLPIVSSAVTINGLITCGPVNPVQTRSDQAAAFAVSFNLTAYYANFALGASYVTFADPNVDTSLQHPEASAPLGQSIALAVTQNALYNVVLKATAGAISKP